MNVENFTPSERSPTRKSPEGRIPWTWNVQNRQIHRDRDRRVAAGAERGGDAEALGDSSSGREGGGDMVLKQDCVVVTRHCEYIV